MDTSKLKPFDLQKGLDGDPVVIRWKALGQFEYTYYPVRTIVKHKGHIAVTFGEDGQGFFRDYDTSDLFMAPKTREMWVNLHDPRASGGIYTVHATEQDADDFTRPMTGKRLGNCAHKIVIEE